MYATILFADDGTEFSLAARPEVEAIAKAFDAEVVLVRAVEAPALIASSLVTPGQAPDGFAYSEHLEQTRAQLLSAGIREVRTMVVEGPAAAAILRVAADTGSDLIVMATHGRSGLTRALSGSIAEEVVRGAEGISVLLVRPAE
jgi:nucleotide-binding universal stress UspA family protein